MDLSTDYGAVLGRFEKVRPAGEGRWKACCPAHPDRSPSLSFWLGRDGRLMFGCWAGCQKRAILGAVGLRWSEMFPPKNGDLKPMPDVRRVPVAWYEYRDEKGQPLFRVVRTEPKGFFQERWEGRWKIGLNKVRRVLYRLDEITAHPTWPVVVVEGEKDADRLAALGLCIVATCNVGGADTGTCECVGKWLDEYSETLAGRRVVVIPDCDRPGLRHANFVVGSLLAHAVGSVRLVRLPLETKPHRGPDVSDWLDGGASAADLVALIRSAPEWRPVGEVA